LEEYLLQTEGDSFLQQYKLPVPPEDIHSLMYYSTLFIGDSQSMISEAAVMGVPAVKCNSFAGRLSVPNEIENKYGLCLSYTPEQFEPFMAKILELINAPNLKKQWMERRNRLLNDKIDLTAFMLWFVENYPESSLTMKENPEYQFRFK
jgi:predicted glycosyltransferase